MRSLAYPRKATMIRPATTTRGKIVQALCQAASRKARPRQTLAASSIALIATRMRPVRCFALWPLNRPMTRSVRDVVT